MTGPGEVSRKDSRVPVQQRSPLIHGPRLLWAQFAALTKKNWQIR